MTEAAKRNGGGADAVVVGAGIVGLTLARRLAAAGRAIVVLDPGEPGAASRAAAGMLAPRIEVRGPGPWFDFLLRARRGFGAFAAELAAETGRTSDYREDGLIALAGDPSEEGELAALAEWQRAAGLPVEELTRAEASLRWPGLEAPAAPPPGESRRFGEGRLFFFPDEAQVDAERLVDSIRAACRLRGVALRLRSGATGFRIERGRITAVRTPQGDISCGLVVNTAGAWAGAVAAWAGEALAVEPIRGEMLSFQTRLRPPRPILSAGPAYSLLRADGRMLLGATMEAAGFAAETTHAGQAWLDRQARRFAPGLGTSEPPARWAGLRPGTPDGLPVIGFSAEVENLYHAAGHFRNGILLASLTAEMALADLDGREEPAASVFRPGRFAAEPA